MSKLTLVFLCLVVLLLVFAAGSFIAKFLFNQRVAKEVVEFFSGVDSSGEIQTKDDLEGLPQNVQRWLEYSGIIGKEKIISVRLKQKAVMRLDSDKPWMPVQAEQYFTLEEPGFIWTANIKAAPLVHIAGRDRYADGRGNILIKLLSLFTVADSKGEETDQGAMLRYLAETIWFPGAALHEYITWEEVDADHAKATMTYGGITASGVFTFNDKGEVIQFEAERYGEFDGEFRLETWSIPLREYKEFAGIKVPTKGDVTWKFASGDFNWFNFELTEIEYNQPLPWQ